MFRENLERNFGFILHDVARLLRTTYDRRVKAMDLTRSQWWVLTHLFRSDGMTQSELADILEVEKATVGRLIDRLEAKGWVQRKPDPRDRRAKRVHLSDTAEESMRVMREIAAEVRSDALSGLSAAEQEHFVDTLLKVKANLMGPDNGNGRRPGNGAARSDTSLASPARAADLGAIEE